MSENKPILIGYHTNAKAIKNNEPEFFDQAKRGKGVDFLLCHVDPIDGSMEENCAFAESTAKAVKELGVPFIANFEKQNFCDIDVTTDGYDWANHSDGTHCLNIHKDYMKALNSQGNCMGVMYDEFEHVIINRNISLALESKFKVDKPTFPIPDTRDPVEQGEVLSNQLKEYKKSLDEKGATTLSGEHVFPVLFHHFARNGIIPNFKAQKESFSNVQFCIAAGAALEYKTPLWNCVDNWYRLTYPGHSPKEMYHNLLFSYLSGCDLVYVEEAGSFYKKGTDELNEYGELYRKFADEYKGKERDYNVQDYKPEIGIIRYDDTFWGQGTTPLMWRNMLFGNPKIKCGKRAKEWIKVMNLITHGETGNGGISWGRIEPFSLRKHRSFASMNNAAVFDHLVKEETLKTLKLAFLCGYTVSDETAKALKKSVNENGLTVVVSKSLAPKVLLSKKYGSYTEISDGKGKWIVVNSFRSRKLKNAVKPYLGEKDVMHYQFGNHTYDLKIAEDGESFTINS